MDHPLVHTLGRRRLLGLAAAATAAVGLGSVGCTPNTGSSSGSTGSRLRVSTFDGSTNDSLDPLRVERQAQNICSGSLFESLVDVDKGLQPVGRLAESFETSDGGVTWDFKLRSGITFHDGEPLTPEDVIYCISRALNPDEGSGNSLAGQLAGILRPQGVQAVDDRTIRFALDKKYVFFPSAMATRFSRIYRAGTKNFDDPVGTGPFVFKSFKPGQSFVATSFDRYWGGAPQVAQLEITNYAEEATRLSAFIDGDVDVMFNLPASSVPDVLAKDLTIIEEKNAQWIALGLNTTVAPFNDPDVVRAIKLAVDRDRVIKIGLGGYGSLGYDQPLPPGDFFFADLPRPVYDPAAAKDLLTRAGYGNGLTLPILEILDIPSVTNVALVLQQQLKDVGIQFGIKRVPQATYYDTAWLKKPFTSNTYTHRSPDEILKLCFTSQGAWNISKQRDPQIDEAVEAAAKTTDVEEQKKQYAIAQRLIAERNSTVISTHISQLTGLAANVSGIVPNVVNKLDLRKAVVSA